MALPAKSDLDLPTPPRLSQLTRKRIERFVTLFPKALVNDTPETIHDLRVASRRLQQILRILLPDSDSSAHRKLSRILRKTRRALGACRNLDVSLGLIEKRLEAASSASMRQSWETVRVWLEEKRATEFAKARARLIRCDLIDFIVRVQARLADVQQNPQTADELSERLRDALATWKNALASAQTNPDVKAIHAFRIAGKRLRYRAESLAALGDSSVKPLVRDLKALQDDLGDWHDRFVLRQYVAEFIERPGFLAEEPGMCRGLLLEMERGKRRDRAAITDVIARAERLTLGEPEPRSSGQTGAIAVNKDQ
jgi:CHAD domain-containing protein